VLTNAADGYADVWVDGALRILQAFARHGAPSRRVNGWTGRWWTYRDAIDLVPMGDKVLVAMPANFNPLMDARELEVRGKDKGWVKLADGFANQGESVRLVRNRRGAVDEVWLGGISFVSEAKVAKEMAARYEKGG
jgi:hypothetical protein